MQDAIDTDQTHPIFEAETFFIENAKIEPTLNTVVNADGSAHTLSARQMSALVTLAKNFGQVVPRTTLHEILCQTKEGHRDRAALSHHIARIRKVLKDSNGESDYIGTIRGGGYYLLTEPSLEPPASWSASPYRGLKQFRHEHAPIFFGRGNDTETICNNLIRRRNKGCALMMVTGASGVGKSSILEAGVIPTLASQKTGSTENLKHAVFRYRVGDGDLFNDFADVIISASPKMLEHIQHSKDLAEALRNEPKQAAQLLQALLLETEQPEPDSDSQEIDYVILIDQLDELLVQQGSEQSQLESFYQVLLSLAHSRWCAVIGAVRLDYLPQCLTSVTLGPELLNGGVYVLHSPSMGELRNMILGPAELMGLSFEEDENGISLADVIIQDALPNLESLPILGYTLETLYESSENKLISFANYHAIGGIQGSLAQRCEQEFTRLSPAAQNSLGSVLSRLSSRDRRGLNAVVGQAAPWHEIVLSEPAMQLVNAFLAARFFTVERNSNGTKVVRLAHDAVLRCWARAHRWLTTNDDLIRIQNKISEEAKSWQDNAHHQSLLLPTGLRLNEARLLIDSELSLSPNEQDFLTASIKKEEVAFQQSKRARQRLTLLAMLFGVMAIASTMFGFEYWSQFKQATALKNDAEKASEIANVERLVAQSTSDLMIETFALNTPENSKGVIVSARELLDRKLKSVEDNKALSPALRAAHFTAIARAYAGLNETAIAIELLEKTLTLQRAQSPVEKILVARTLTILAHILTEGQHSTIAAKQHLIEAIKLLRESDNAQSQLIHTLGEYANTELNESSFEKASKAYQEAIDMIHNSPQDYNSELRKYKLALARILTLQSQFKSAKSLTLEVLNEDRATLQENDPAMVDSLSQYAYWFYSIGELDRAVELYQQALEIQKFNYASDHWDVAISNGRLGHLLVQVGRYDDAVTVLEEAVASAVNYKGHNVVRVAIFKVSLADAYLHLGDYKKTKHLAQSALSVISTKQGPVSGLESIAKSLLGAALAYTGGCKEGSDLLDQSYRNMLQHRGADSPYTIEIATRKKEALANADCRALH